MILAALLLAWQPAPTAAASPPAEVSIGYGTCEDWVRARYYWSGQPRRDERARRMQQWAWGYVTAFERYGRPGRDAQVRVRDSIWDGLDAYCRANQPTLFGEAVSLVVERLRRQRPPRRR